MGIAASLFERATRFTQRTAITDTTGSYSFHQLLDASSRVASSLLGDANDLRERRVVFLIPPSFEHVTVQWGIWRAGGIAVPLAVGHPEPELAYVVDDARVSAIVVHPDFEDRLRRIAEQRSLPLLSSREVITAAPARMPEVDSSRRAMILYTSGTTGKPKGVVTTHGNLLSQVDTLIEAWEWVADDCVLHVLPLHHVHGIVNVLTCALAVGARCDMLPRFDATRVWERLSDGDLTLFMAVPTIYAKLIAAWKLASPDRQRTMSAGSAQLRLMVSGSAALPVSTLQEWKSITGHVLLERYGMTEIGMALSNPLHGQRVPGHVGTPLPGVEVRRTDESGRLVPSETPAEIEVRGPNVFLEYWQQSAATQTAFRDGWFRTGDVAVVEKGAYRILGRTSVDIIKTGGFKVSALEIEEVLRSHPHIHECAVIGVEDPEWGECVSVAIVPRDEQTITTESLREWAKQRLAVYKIPQQLLLVDQLPRNAMGKVTKPEVKRMFVQNG